MGIESVFKSMAGADWNSSGLDGLSAAEFGAFLKEQSGADGKFNKKEFKSAGEQLGLSGDDSKSIMEAFGKDGQISVDKLQKLLENAAGSDKAFNLDELKGGLENLADRAEKKLAKDEAEAKDPTADFARDAGADKAIDENEFKAMCENAGIDEKTAKKAFDKAAGADGKISEDEFKEAFGGEEASESKFKSAVKDLAGEKDPFAQFGRDAGADDVMSKDEFKALAEKAGIDEETAEKAFDKIAGADGEISKDEFKAEGGLGDTKLSKDDFKSKVEELGASDESSSADESESPDAPSEDDGPSSSDPSNWSHSVEDGKATINLGDKYTITAEENGEQFTIKNNETGHETKVSGDPHVDVGNDGQNDFDFKKDMTFELDDGTKVTVGTIDAGNGTTFSSELTITNGENAIKVTGLAGGADGENNLKVVQSTEGEAWDEEAEDGFTIDEAGSGWTAPNGDVVDQDVINKAEA